MKNGQKFNFTNMMRNLFASAVEIRFFHGSPFWEPIVMTGVRRSWNPGAPTRSYQRFAKLSDVRYVFVI